MRARSLINLYNDCYCAPLPLNSVAFFYGLSYELNVVAISSEKGPVMAAVISVHCTEKVIFHFVRSEDRRKGSYDLETGSVITV